MVVDTNSSVVIRVRESTRGPAGFALVAWSVIVAVGIFAERANTARLAFELVAVIATFLFAAYAGWNRRLGALFFAPVVSWMFAWFPLIVGEMVRAGIVKGFFLGLLFATVGWIAIGFVEFIVLFAIAVPFRVLSGMVHHDPKITIEGPFNVR